MEEGIKSVYDKLLEARTHIKNSKLKKAGRNSFSKYDYFTPEQVDKLVFDACKDCGLITMFSLMNSEHGLHGELTVLSLADNENVVFKQYTAVPTITATNQAQMAGGMATYSERYLLMSAFNIKDNSLDFDTSENTQEQAKPKPVVKPDLTEDKVQNAVNWATNNKKTLSDIKDIYTVGKDIEAQLIALLPS